MKLLCAADLHLGRRPSRLPAELGDVHGLEADLMPQAAWRRLVEVAVAERVTAVLLAGDLLDDEHDYFETFGDLRAGVERLIDAGVEVLAVSGNHDVAVLPRLARSVPGLRVLGLGGSWEVATLTDDDVTVHVAGWSYPQPYVDTSPVPYLAAALEGLATGTVVGLLHCDRDQTGSRYAPVTSAELDSAPVDAWLLGHVHKPDFGLRQGNGSVTGRYSGYLGAISPADPGEEGVFGAWLIEVRGSTLEPLSVRRVPLATLRYETVTLDAGDVAAPEELVVAVSRAVSELAAEIDADSTTDAPLLALGVRLRLVGRSPDRAELARALVTDDPRRLVLGVGTGGAVVFVHDHRFEVGPTHDLEAIAAGHDPLALVARSLLLLEDDVADPEAGPERARDGDRDRARERAHERGMLLEAARANLDSIGGGRHYTALPPADLSDEVLTGLLRRAALDLLDAMLASRDAA